jgi:putative membrane protein (TIGR04086 family)
MQKKKRTKASSAVNDTKNIIIKILIGSGVGTLVFFGLTALAAFILLKNDSDTTIYKYIMLLVGAISGFLSGFIAVRPLRKNGIAFGSVSALPVYLIAVLVSVLMARSGIGIIGWILLPVMVVFASIGGIVAVNKRKKTR